MQAKKIYVVEQELEGIRLDKCIAQLDEEISRMMVQRLLADDKIKVNRARRKSLL